jgi:hypothetical protein
MDRPPVCGLPTRARLSPAPVEPDLPLGATQRSRERSHIDSKELANVVDSGTIPWRLPSARLELEVVAAAGGPTRGCPIPSEAARLQCGVAVP